MSKLTRALIYYVEDTQLHNMAAPENASSARSTKPTSRPGNTTRTATTTTRRRSGASTSDRDEQLLRYSRHILLTRSASRARNAYSPRHALVIGAGGLGSPAALYLASAGIGKLTLVDDDTVDLTNLQRQILHTQARVGMAKAESGRHGAGRDQPGQSRSFPCSSGWPATRWTRWSPTADVVLDCSDNFATRHAVNRACVHHRKPLVSGAAIRFDGQISVFDIAPRRLPRATTACFPRATTSRKSAAR